VKRRFITLVLCSIKKFFRCRSWPCRNRGYLQPKKKTGSSKDWEYTLRYARNSRNTNERKSTSRYTESDHSSAEFQDDNLLFPLKLSTGNLLMIMRSLKAIRTDRMEMACQRNPLETTTTMVRWLKIGICLSGRKTGPKFGVSRFSEVCRYSTHCTEAPQNTVHWKFLLGKCTGPHLERAQGYPNHAKEDVKFECLRPALVQSSTPLNYLGLRRWMWVRQRRALTE